ncbi:putative zinc finger protein 840 [Coccinella septempunctata]|uniref:putative zinc finger protein 840 n=1 Tax=Coccinella septempunctata TaxID=41139 RepID=UPI001D07593C|nr:putative zinc finger protein 840 [Coccinella septempunctata]
MEGSEEICNIENVQYTKTEIPQCEVVIDEAETTSFVDSSQIPSENMITYVVIPSDIDTDRIIINYCEAEEESEFLLADTHKTENQCVLCGETFKNCFLLQEHFSTVHVGSDLICQICKLQCTTDHQLLRHYNKHKYSCNLCEASFAKHEDLFNHKKTHSQTLPYACNICNEAYSSTREISLHIREKHSNKRPHSYEESNKNKKFANEIVVQIKEEET